MKGVFPMKRRFAAVAAAVLLCAVPALAQDKLPPLRTGVDGTFAPHAMPKLGGGVEGFQIDLFTEVAKRLKDHIYAAGGRQEPDLAYTAFRGRLPTTQALLRKKGLAA